jgi:hypothetical protein
MGNAKFRAPQGHEGMQNFLLIENRKIPVYAVEEDGAEHGMERE